MAKIYWNSGWKENHYNEVGKKNRINENFSPSKSREPVRQITRNNEYEMIHSSSAGSQY